MFDAKMNSVRCFVDGLNGVHSEQVITPGNEIVEILHDDSFLKCVEASPCHQIWVERVFTPSANPLVQLIQALLVVGRKFIILLLAASAGEESQQVSNELVRVIGGCHFKKWLRAPELLWIRQI